MKRKKTRSPDVPKPYEAPECESVSTLSSGMLCSSASGNNEHFQEIIYWQYFSD